MQAKKVAGPEAASQKYDLLTALGCHALGSPPGVQRLVLRFITLVTARYNWRQGLLHVGQREIARLWAVDERTVKREMAKLRGLGWITVESPARRGRVASYALDIIAIRAATRDAWVRVGADFDERMRGTGTPVAGGTVVPFPRPEPAGMAEEGAEEEMAAAPGAAPGDVWAAMRATLRAEDPAVFATWFDALRSAGRAGDCLVLVAPSAFHATYLRTHYAERLARALGRAGGAAGIRIVGAVDDGGRGGEAGG
jgi:hypothetical protein